MTAVGLARMRLLCEYAALELREHDAECKHETAKGLIAALCHAAGVAEPSRYAPRSADWKALAAAVREELAEANP